MSKEPEPRKRSSSKPAGAFVVKQLSTESAIRRHQNQGFGSGEGKAYKPWLGVHNVSSTGKSTRCHGLKTGRTHTFLSDLEYHFFLILEWDNSVVDIREQYPLFPQTEIEEIAEALGVKVPHLVGAKDPMTMTTDFLVITEKGKEAWSIKPSHALEKRRTLEKLEIERIYWERRGVPFGICTEQEMPGSTLKNLRWFRNNQGRAWGMEEIESIRKFMEARLDEAHLSQIARECDSALGLDTGVSMEAAKHLLVQKIWAVDISEEIRPNLKLRLL